MRIQTIKHVENAKLTKVLDCFVDRGYVKRAHGSLPDIDIDFESERRPDVKEYLERRYNVNGLERVFSAGTFSAEKIKSAVKDAARIRKLNVGMVNYITAIFEDDEMSWTDLMNLAYNNKKVHDFIVKYPDLFEEIVPIIGQPRSASVHPSAVIVSPEHIKGEVRNCYEILPIKKMDGLLVSELTGVDIDEMGLLKCDVLAIAELSRISSMIHMINDNYHANISLESIVQGDLNEPAVYDVIKKGLTQGVFQMSGDGITRFIKQMKPSNINDLVALVALFRPGPLDSGSSQAYIDCKRGDVEPEYLWGTYEIVKDTYGQLIYQEQVSKIAQKIGNLSLGDGVNLVKALSKKKIEKVRKFKDKYFKGAKQNGCPKEAAERIWEIVEAGASYLFNQSHATAYGLTGYIGAWLKVHYPIAFYTVLLKWVDKEKLPTLMNEMREIGNATIVQPDINISGIDFVTDFQTNEIYWSLSRIRNIGAVQAKYIFKERTMYGEYRSLEHFIKRIFRARFADEMLEELPENVTYGRCPVTSLSVKHLILAGAFDKLEGISSIMERYGLIKKMAKMLKLKQEAIEHQFPEDLIGKHYFWSQKQINISGFGSIDYKRIYDNMEKPQLVKKYRYCNLKEFNAEIPEKFGAVICATIAEVSEKTYKDKRTGETKHFGKVMLQQNTDMIQLVVWNDAWIDCKRCFKDKRGSIVVAVVQVKYSDYDDKNILQINKGAFVCLISNCLMSN